MNDMKKVLEAIKDHFVELPKSGGCAHWVEINNPLSFNLINDRGNTKQRENMLPELREKYPEYQINTVGDWTYDGGWTWYEIKLEVFKK